MIGFRLGIYIAPRWRIYEQEQEVNLLAFMLSLEEDKRSVEQYFDIQLKNPAVTNPFNDANRYRGLAISSWETDARNEATYYADLAAWHSVLCLHNSYKTATAHLIVESRESLESCAASVGYRQRLSHHSNARRHYATARHIDIKDDAVPVASRVARVDSAINHYIIALEAAEEAFCKEESRF